MEVDVANSCTVEESAEMSDSQSDDVEPYILIKDESNNITIYKGDPDIFLPSIDYCATHDSDLSLFEDDALLKPGDKFATHSDFVQYVNEHAKKWLYYYKCAEAEKIAGSESYLYTCVYLRNKEKYVRKGIRKRANNSKTDCPCRISLKRLPNENELTVVSVCNHHDHQLSAEEFYKLQHGRRLPPYVREEIMDLLTMKINYSKIKKYVFVETGFKMSRTFFYTIIRNMKLRNINREISTERIEELTEKIALIDHIESNDEDDMENNVTRSKDESSFQSSPKTSTIKKRRSKYSDDFDDDNEYQIERNTWANDSITKSPNRSGKKSRSSKKKLSSHNLMHDIIDNDSMDDSLNDSYITYETVTEDGIKKHNENVKKSKKQKTGPIIAEDITNANGQYILGNYIEDGESVTYIYNSQDENDGTIETLDEEGNTIVYDNGNVCTTEEFIEYVNNNGTEVVEYVENEAEASTSEDFVANNVAVQTTETDKTDNQQVVPVFDVYMKDGNVTGFVLNDDVMNKLKNDGPDKAVQTFEDTEKTGERTIEQRTNDTIIERIGNIVKKHEYIHKYNIDKYMLQSHFPKYIEMLSKELRISVLQMFTNIYLEKAMFKMTTTQKGKEGNTRIWYVTNTVRKPRRNSDGKNDEESGRLLVDVLLLREKVRELKRKNQELVLINKHLEELAHNMS